MLLKNASRSRVLLSSPSLLVNSILKPIILASNDKSEPLKSVYASTCENFFKKLLIIISLYLYFSSPVFFELSFFRNLFPDDIKLGVFIESVRLKSNYNNQIKILFAIRKYNLIY